MAQMTLKAARVNAGLTQLDAAKKLDVSNKTLCSWEKGNSMPKANKIELICELYNVAYNDLIFLPGNPLKAEM